MQLKDAQQVGLLTLAQAAHSAALAAASPVQAGTSQGSLLFSSVQVLGVQAAKTAESFHTCSRPHPSWLNTQTPAIALGHHLP